MKPRLPFRIAFVCTGNICRSPLAEALALHHVQLEGFADAVALESFGTHDYHVGEAADRRTVATARKFGIDLSRHRARRIAAEDCARVDLLLAMDSSHERHLRAMAGAHAERVRLYLPFLGIDEGIDVPDPYYGDSAGFVAVHRLLGRASVRLAERLPALIAARHG